MHSMAALSCRDKQRVLKLRRQLRCLQWLTRSVNLLKIENGTTACSEISAGSWISAPSSWQSHIFFLGKFSSADHWLPSVSSCSICTLSYHSFTPLESVSSSVLIIFFSIHFSCRCYCHLPYSSSLVSPDQLQLVWKYLTKNCCILKNESVIFDPFQLAAKRCCLHQGQVFTLNHVHTPSDTAWNVQDLYRTQQNGICWCEWYRYLYAPLLLLTLLLFLLLQVVLSTYWDPTVLETAQIATENSDSAPMCL